MNYSLSLLGKTMFGLQNQGMLKSTKDRLDRQAQRDGKIEFYEKQKQNLKNTEAQTVEEIAKKLEMFHSYEDEIKAAKQEYNSSQMLHVLDEAQERAEKIAKAAEKNKPKTPEERRKDALDEAAGKDTSVNYLAANVLKAAGVPTNDYQSFLLKLQEEYPIISAVRTDKTADKTLDKASNKSDKATGSKNKQADSDMLNDYKLLQYYRLFDWEDK